MLTHATGGLSIDAGRRLEILVVDDDRDLLDLVAQLVEQAGLIPLVAPDPEVALDIFERQHPGMAVIDLNLSPWDGFEVLRELRRRSRSLPILVLTARGSEDDKVRALDMGADDYVVKPFGRRELLARIKAHARRAEVERSGDGAAAVLEVGALRLDLSERMLAIDGHEDLRLTGTEFRLLEYLLRNSDCVVTTPDLAKHVWGYDDAPAREVVRVTVHRLRRKMGEDGQHRRFIHTIPGVGLKLRPMATGPESNRSV